MGRTSYERRQCQEESLSLAERVGTACIEAAIQGYEQASLSGLCHEGAWEAAIDTVWQLDLEAFVRH